jgi:hypothetical protein
VARGVEGTMKEFDLTKLGDLVPHNVVDEASEVEKVVNPNLSRQERVARSIKSKPPSQSGLAPSQRRGQSVKSLRAEGQVTRASVREALAHSRMEMTFCLRCDRAVGKTLEAVEKTTAGPHLVTVLKPGATCSRCRRLKGSPSRGMTRAVVRGTS